MHYDAMKNNGVIPSTTPMRDAAVDALAAAQTYNDMIRRLEEQRADNPDRAHQISRMIGETNARLGFALKAADVHATIAVADAVTDFMDFLGDTGLTRFSGESS